MPELCVSNGSQMVDRVNDLYALPHTPLEPLTTAEAAVLSGVDRQTVGRWIRQGHLAGERSGKAGRHGRGYQVSREAIEALVAQRRNPADGSGETFRSIRQAAAYAGVSSSTVDYWIATGRLSAMVFQVAPNRREYRISKAALDAQIAANRERDERASAEAQQRAAAAAALNGQLLPRDLVEAVAFHDRLLTRWRRSEASHKQYRHFLGRYLRFLKEAGIAPGLEALTPQLVGQCQDWMRANVRGKQAGAVSEATFVRCIKAFGRAMHEHGVYENHPLERQRPVCAPHAERPPYVETDLRRLLEAAQRGTEPARDRALMLLLMDTGCRIGELCRADVGDVDLDIGSILFRRTKNGHPRQVLFGVDDGGPCVAAVRAWLATRQVQPGDPLFTMSAAARLTPKAAGRLLARLGRAAGVPNAIPHRFRHTAATAFLSEQPGAEIQLRARLGHLSARSLQGYVHQSQAMSREGARVASISSRLLAPSPLLPSPAADGRLQTLQAILALLEQDSALSKALALTLVA